MFLFPPFWSFFPPCFNSSLSRAFSYQIQLQLAAHPQPLTVSIYGRMGKNACSSTDLFVWCALHFMIDEERRLLFELIYLPNGGSRSAINSVFMKIAEFFAPRLLATFSAPFSWIIIHNLQFFLLYNLHFRIAFLAVWFSGTARRTSLAVSAPSWESGRVGIRGRQSWSRTYSLCLEIPSGLYHKCSSIAQYLRCRVANFKRSVMNTFMTRQISDGEYWKKW